MYVRIKKWHLIMFDSRAGLHKTRCGLWAEITAPLHEGVPLGEDTCESCLRLTVRDNEQ